MFGFNQLNNTIYKLSDSLAIDRKLPVEIQFQLNSTIGSFALDDYGNVFIIDKSKKLWALFHNKATWTLIDEFNMVRSIFLDAENNLYVPDEGALYVFRNFAFTHYSPEKDGLPKYIWSVVEDNKGQLWLGSWGYGLKVWDGANYTDLSDVVLHKDGSPALQTIYMGSIRDRRGNILIAGAPSMYVFSPDEKLLNIIEYNGKSILYIHEDRSNGLIYAGTTEGVFVMDSNYNEVEHIHNPELMRRPVVSLEKDNNGHLWIGTYESLAVYDGHQLKGDFKNNKGEPLSAKCIQKDDFGNIWFGTHDGLSMYREAKFIKIQPAIFKTTIQFIKQLKESQLLIGLRDGIVLADAKRYADGEPDWYRYFGEDDGFTGIEPGQNGAFVRPDGKVWIVTTDQLTLFDPQLVKKRHDYIIRPFIEELLILDKQEQWKTLYQRSHTSDTQQQIEVLNHNNRIRFNFKAIHHTCPENLRYSYRLKGYDDDWSAMQNERYVEFTNLSSGEYVFQIRARNLYEPDPDNWPEAELSFLVPTPYFQQWWFLLLLILFAVSLTSTVTYMITRSIKKRRERDLQLQMEMNQLQHAALKAQVEPHFASNLLNSVNAAILKQDKATAARVLNRFASLIRDLLYSADKSVHSLREELDFISRYIELEKTNLKDRLKYEVMIDEQIDQRFQVPVMLIHTFVENSVKHAIRQNPAGGSIKVAIQKSGNGMRIMVTDTGKGKSNKAKQPSTRKGVQLIRRIVLLYNKKNKKEAKLHITDNESGRTVVIEIPDGYEFN